MGISRAFVAVAAIALGVLFALGSVLAILFEVQGFTGDRDGNVDRGYVALLVLGLLTCIVIPGAVASWSFPENRKAVLVITAAAAVTALITAGISLG